MKKDLIDLIDKVYEIEKLFHIVGGNGVPTVKVIHDVQSYQDWLQEVRFELQDIYDRTNDHFIEETLNHFNKRMDGLNDKQIFAEMKGKLMAIRKHIDKYYRDESAEATLENRELEQIAENEPKIFISHCNKDKSYVEKIVNLLLDGMGLNEKQLFCSSISEYGVPLGMDIFDYLLDLFWDYNLHVIFIHSDNYYQSPVCLNEMGAAWVLKSTVTSILLPGFGFEKMTGVVNEETIAIRLDEEEFELKDKLNQLYYMIVEEFGIDKKTDIIWEKKRDSFIDEVRRLSIADTGVMT